MISSNRRKEAPPFLHPSPLRYLGGLRYFHSTLRQGLYRFFSASGLRRVLIPDFAPDGIRVPFQDAGFALGFYPVPLDMRLDAEALRAAVAAHRPEVFVYIHYFGLYLEDNLKLVKEVLPAGVLLVEDFAHSLPQAEVIPSGDLALYAFSKQLGVADGSVVWFHNRGLPSSHTHGPATALGRTLIRRLRARLALESAFVRLQPPARLQEWALRLAGKQVDYYSHLSAHYPEITQSASAASMQTLASLDFEAVGQRRKSLAALYLGGLDERFRLGLPHAAYLRQPLLGFPIQVDDQVKFHSHLVRRGVIGIRLTNNWWQRTGVTPGELYHRHYLLPISHYFSDGQVRTILKHANAYPGIAPAASQAPSAR